MEEASNPVFPDPVKELPFIRKDHITVKISRDQGYAHPYGDAVDKLRSMSDHRRPKKPESRSHTSE